MSQELDIDSVVGQEGSCSWRTCVLAERWEGINKIISRNIYADNNKK